MPCLVSPVIATLFHNQKTNNTAFEAKVCQRSIYYAYKKFMTFQFICHNSVDKYVKKYERYGKLT